jgi:hypothetical protein
MPLGSDRRPAKPVRSPARRSRGEEIGARFVWLFALPRILWATVGLFAVWLLASAWDGTILGVIMASSGVLLKDWRDNPISEVARGEWICPMPLYSVVSAAALSIGVYSFLGWCFS